MWSHIRSGILKWNWINLLVVCVHVFVHVCVFACVCTQGGASVWVQRSSSTAGGYLSWLRLFHLSPLWLDLLSCLKAPDSFWRCDWWHIYNRPVLVGLQNSHPLSLHIIISSLISTLNASNENWGTQDIILIKLIKCCILIHTSLFAGLLVRKAKKQMFFFEEIAN